MTDLEKLQELLNSFDIEYEMRKTTSENDSHLVLLAGMRNVTGYVDFVTIFEFDENGKFKVVGVGNNVKTFRNH